MVQNDGRTDATSWGSGYDWHRSGARQVQAEAIPLDILYEDEHLPAVNKPGGMVSHPSYKNAGGTLINGVLDLALDRDPWDRRKVTVTDRGGQPSVTRYERVAVSGRRIGSGDPPLDSARGELGSPSSLVRCRLVTGRAHQIRVHLAAKGRPIVGDPTYGRRDAPVAFPRQALHAWRMAFRHPVTGHPVAIVAPLPDDIRGLCASLYLGTPDRDSVMPRRQS